MNDVKCNIHNRFDFEVVDGRTGEIKRRARAFNVVTNNLWSYLITTTTAFATYIQYGSGSGTPSASDTSLFNRSGGVGVTEVSQTTDYANKLITRVVKIVLGLNDAVGVTITEVGLGAGNGNGSLTTHAMLQDMNGNPISISKTNTDIINIYATIYCHWTVGDEAVFYPKNGLNNTLVGRSNVLGSLTMGFNDDLFGVSTNKTWSKAADLSNKRIVYTCPRLSAGEANFNGITYMQGTGDYDGIAIKKGTDSWSKFTITNESVGTGDGETTKFKTKFHYPYNAVVKVNGVAQSAQVVEVKNLPVTNEAFAMPISESLSDENSYVLVPYASGANPVVLVNTLLSEGVKVRGGYAVANSSQPNMTIFGSDDLETWTQVAYRTLINHGADWLDIPEEYRSYKFYKFTANTYYGQSYINYTMFRTDWDGYNIIFANAPAVGDVITITYDTDCIPKDSDHVLDATFTLQFGEYNE